LIEERSLPHRAAANHDAPPAELPMASPEAETPGRAQCADS